MAQNFAPEEVSGAVLVTEVATDLAAAHHRVTVVTCAPNYPPWPGILHSQPRVQHVVPFQQDVQHHGYRPPRAGRLPQGKRVRPVGRRGRLWGWAVDINAFDQLAASILRLRADQNRLEQLGANGRAVLERKYSRVRCVGMIERLLRRVRKTQRNAAWMAI